MISVTYQNGQKTTYTRGDSFIDDLMEFGLPKPRLIELTYQFDDMDARELGRLVHNLINIGELDAFHFTVRTNETGHKKEAIMFTWEQIPQPEGIDRPPLPVGV